MDFEKIRFDEKGLVPAVVQDYFTKEVLTVAYMNRESLEITGKGGYTCFYSRSRQELWRKGETSGNKQKVVSIVSDCDNDALVIEVIKNGPACHTGAESCFHNMEYVNPEETPFSYKGLYEMIEGRKTQPKEGSYTTYLFEKGMDKILKKVGEEATEIVIAAKNPNQEEVKYEISDFLYHMMVLMVERGITWEDITKELSER